jgi:hypothetical protein
MSQSTNVLLGLGLMIFAVGTVVGLNQYTQQKKENYIVTTDTRNGIVSFPKFPSALDPRSAPAVNSGIVRNASNNLGFQAAPQDSANYSVTDMIDLGGCAKLKDLPPYPRGGYDNNDLLAVRQAFAQATSKEARDEIKEANAKLARFATYQASSSAENMLPDVPITVAIDPTQDYIYQRSLNMQIRSMPRGTQDHFRGDVQIVNPAGNSTVHAAFNEGQGSQGTNGVNFASRFGNTTANLTQGYFSNYNDIQQSHERNATLMQNRAQFTRDQALTSEVANINPYGDFLRATTIEQILG